MYAETGHLQKSTSKLPVPSKIYHFLSVHPAKPQSSTQTFRILSLQKPKSRRENFLQQNSAVSPKTKPAQSQKSIRDAQILLTNVAGEDLKEGRLEKRNISLSYSSNMFVWATNVFLRSPLPKMTISYNGKVFLWVDKSTRRGNVWIEK